MILLFVACSTNKLRLRSDNRFSYQGKFKNKFYGIQLLPDNRFVYEEGSIKYGRSSKGTWTRFNDKLILRSDDDYRSDSLIVALKSDCLIPEGKMQITLLSNDDMPAFFSRVYYGQKGYYSGDGTFSIPHIGDTCILIAGLFGERLIYIDQSARCITIKAFRHEPSRRFIDETWKIKGRKLLSSDGKSLKARKKAYRVQSL